MADLRTDYKDDILDLTQNTQRKYRMITNDDGTVSFEDVTVYSQIGDSFGAADVNTITNALNNTEGSVRYNAETDMVQIKDAEGVWHDYASGGLTGLQLFYNGDQCIDITGGWDILNGTTSITETLNVYSGNPDGTWQSARITAKKINLTEYTRLKVKCTQVAVARILMSKTKSFTDYAKSFTLSVGDNEFDITGYTDEFYIFFACIGTVGWSSASKIWLTK